MKSNELIHDRQPAPKTDAELLREAVEEIRQDAEDRPKAYQLGSIVPEGGE